MRVLLGMRLPLFSDTRFKFVDIGFHSYFTVLSRVFVSLAVAVCAACSQGIVLQVLLLLCVLILSLFVFCECVVFGTCLFVVVSRCALSALNPISSTTPAKSRHKEHVKRQNLKAMGDYSFSEFPPRNERDRGNPYSP